MHDPIISGISMDRENEVAQTELLGHRDRLIFSWPSRQPLGADCWKVAQRGSFHISFGERDHPYRMFWLRYNWSFVHFGNLLRITAHFVPVHLNHRKSSRS